MNNLEELTLKIEKIIEAEKSTNPDIKYISPSHSKLIAQIISNYNLEPSKDSVPSAQLIFLGAPTGAGKDTLIKKIILDNDDKNFIILNMDIFRHYHNEISGDTEHIADKDYALKTNQTSYELYYIIQETVLREFPGTNVIVTGTMRDLDWVKDIISRYKNDDKTNYSTTLITLAVPSKESAFSIFERYLNMVSARGSSNVPLRYTNLDYHDDTVEKFLTNIQFFENDFHTNKQNRLFDNIKVYKRNRDIFDLNEDTLIYDTDTPTSDKCAFAHIHHIINSPTNIDSSRVSHILNIISQNVEYLKSQDLYKSILNDLKKVLVEFDKNYENDNISKS